MPPPNGAAPPGNGEGRPPGRYPDRRPRADSPSATADAAPTDESWSDHILAGEASIRPALPVRHPVSRTALLLAGCVTRLAAARGSVSEATLLALVGCDQADLRFAIGIAERRGEVEYCGGSVTAADVSGSQSRTTDCVSRSQGRAR